MTDAMFTRLVALVGQWQAAKASAEFWGEAARDASKVGKPSSRDSHLLREREHRQEMVEMRAQVYALVDSADNN